MSPSLVRFLSKGKDLGKAAVKKGAKVLDNLDEVSDGALSAVKKGGAAVASKANDATGGILGEAAEDVKKIGGKMFNVTPNDDTFLGRNIRFSKPVGLGIVGAGAVYGIGKPIAQANERSRFGEIEAGYLPGTVNATFSKSVGKTLQKAVDNEGRSADFSGKVMSNASNTRIAGVNPEIVFAMHNLRNDSSIGGGLVK